jgi:hypothetical protein
MTNKKRTSGFISRLIFSILRDLPETRDDWMLLVKIIHDMEMSVRRIPKENYYAHFFNKEFSNVYTIKRIWALIQERNPRLRGEKWEERQRSGKEISDEIVNHYQLDLF